MRGPLPARRSNAAWLAPASAADFLVRSAANPKSRCIQCEVERSGCFWSTAAPTGILTAEIINWTGEVILVPLSQLSDLAKREEARRTGVYCLIGPEPDQPDRDRVYLGEGHSVMQRLAAHDKDPDKDFWTRVVVVIGKDNITKSHGRFLESRLIEIATSRRWSTELRISRIDAENRMTGSFGV